MNQSQSIGALAAALAKAQGQIKHAVYDRTNPHFKNKYATLPSVMDACRGPLSANGIAIIQGLEAEGSVVKVTMTLAHASGEWVSSTLAIPAAQSNVQGMMSAVSYGRRYLLSSMVGIVADDASDDDGNEASQPPREERYALPPVPVKAEPANPAMVVWHHLVDVCKGDKVKARERFESAATAHFGVEVPPTAKWSDADCLKVNSILFPEEKAA